MPAPPTALPRHDSPKTATSIHASGFTLIELLVVITIIVVLLSLLTPALDKALYQAELLQCAGNIKAGTGAVTQYAFEHRRHYATRGFSGAHLSDWVKVTGDYNLIGDLSDYGSVKMFTDPFTDKIDLSEEANHPDTSILAENSWFNDWTRPGWDGIVKVMKRVGDRLTYLPLDQRSEPAGSARLARFTTLVGDLDVRGATNGGVIIGHPDPFGRVPEQVYQNESYLINRALPASKVTLNWYLGGNAFIPNRGPLDLNYGYQDGSVLRLNQVVVDDERVDHIIASSDIPNRLQQLPRE